MMTMLRFLLIIPLSAMTSAKYRLLVLANPMTPVIECFRLAAMGGGDFRPAHLAYAAVVAVAALGLGLVIFTRIERNFMDSV